MTRNPSAADLRRWAMRCSADAADAKDAGDRERLLRMHEALLMLADNEDWLSGVTADMPPHKPADVAPSSHRR